ncbi:MAG: hypothetical protein PHQ90_00740 [Sulfuricurvum sp.]|uniref:hypothetical protein n=1 Tax=Sulfuricurvum sp. TaxID=2025608 RepID=UPI00260741E7|nr:hypothetical protein [Sulfuricurvum sp.]MDD2367792.1 hypothetical protein [Sulfuricurvum sp.]MDD2950929.1 hypothetical protein [Sulfuricurvum sp.]MDD5117971.1 hypothetical protein [Sulfuricurvum sp.]
MKFIFIFLLLLSHHLYADVNQKLFELYQKGMYTEACNYGYNFFAQNEHNEPFVSLVGFACLKADQIDRLSPVMSILSQTPDARSNSAYLALIVMQKKLLMRALYDNQPLQNLKFPTSSYILSKVFDLYVQNPKKNDIIKEYPDPINSRQAYKLYTTEVNGKKSIAIDEYYDKILTNHHVY